MSMYGWERYLSIEQDFLTARQYVAFEVSDNSVVCSDFFTKSIILLGAEIEAAMKKLCGEINGSTPGNIGKYKQTILSFYPNITKWTVRLHGTEKRYTPFEEWEQEKEGLSWWDVYGKVKHNLVDKGATLEVALKMLAAYQTLLFVIHIKQHEGEESTVPYAIYEQPKLLLPTIKHIGGPVSVWDGESRMTCNVHVIGKALKNQEYVELCFPD